MSADKFIRIFLSVVFIFNAQASIDVYIDDFLIEKADDNYVRDITAYIDEDGSQENAVVANFTMIKPFPETSEGHLVLVGASMGDYVLTTPVDFKLPLCDMMTERTLIGPFLEELGFREDDCPPKAGNYGTSGYVIPTEDLTEDFPPNKYKAIFDITDGDNTIMAVVFFINVQ